MYTYMYTSTSMYIYYTNKQLYTYASLISANVKKNLVQLYS